MNNNSVITVENLSISFEIRQKQLFAIRNVSLDICKDEILAIVGESGSGKTVLMRSVSGLLSENGKYLSGDIYVQGKNTSFKDLDKLKGNVFSFVFQEPATALNPVTTIGTQISDVILKHKKCTKTEAKKKAIELLGLTGIDDPEKRYNCYPHEFSGGMLQRVVIAIAISCEPEIIVCDEATTSLDVTTQYQIMELLVELQKSLHFSMVIITHDFGVVAKMADRVAIMYAGEIVETGTVKDIFYSPKNPYTISLLASLPQLQNIGEPFYYLSGITPVLYTSPDMDVFSYRNINALKIDYLKNPPFFKVGDEHFVKSWAAHESAPKYELPANLMDIQGNSVNNLFDFSKIIPFDYSGNPILSVKNLTVKYKRGKTFTAVDDISLDVYKGEILSIVGESGSGKTTLGKTLAGILKQTSGSIIFENKDIQSIKDKKELFELKRKIQMVFQNQTMALNDRANIEYIVSEGLNNFYSLNRDEIKEKIENMLNNMALSSDILSKYPHELSGGQRQRIGIARSLIIDPSVLIADEPVASLDVSIRSQILNLLKQYRDKYKTTIIFISHDMSVVRLISDRIVVMKKGKIVEMAKTKELFLYPMHPYTKTLMASIPLPDPVVEKKRSVLFTEEDKKDIDRKLMDIGNEHFVYCSNDELTKYKEIRKRDIITNPLHEKEDIC